MLDVTLFTDPACPFAFSAEPVRQRLRWHYGDQLRWTTRMIVLTREPGEAEKLAEGAPTLQRLHGMPIDPAPYPRPASSEPACQAVVATRLHSRDRADALLRRLRVEVMKGGLLDEQALIDRAATQVGIDPFELAKSVSSERVARELERDAAAARSPSEAARALDHRLGGPPGERRYTAPTYVIGGIVVPGFNPAEAYEIAVANAAPSLRRKPTPEQVSEVLAWAVEPLATAEVAAIMSLPIDEVRPSLEEVADWEPAGADGYWTG